MRAITLGLCFVLFACGGGDEGGGVGGGGVGGGGGGGGGGDVTNPWSTEPAAGIATYYAATGAGACSFEASSDLAVVALGDGSYANASMCGACLEVTGPKGTVTVRVVDRCPECAANHLDLSLQAFEQIAERQQGRVDIEYKFVRCDVEGPVRYRYKDGSSRYWTGIQVQNHKLPIEKLEVQRDGEWRAVPRQHYNYFVAEDGVGPHPDGLPVRITAVDGQQLVDTLSPVGESELPVNVQTGSGQFR